MDALVKCAKAKCIISFSMQQLNFPLLNVQLRQKEGFQEVWDVVRKKWIFLTPEEWVRQHLMHYLNTEKDFSLSLMAVEKTIKVNGMNRRYDLVVYDNTGKPLLLAECKAPDVKLSQGTFDQAARYNMTIRVPYLLITNGLEHFCCKIDFEKESYSFLQEIPSKEDLL